MSDKRRMITAALPYGNGPLHFGHLAGVYIPADIYFRHSQLAGVDAVYVCGSDEHGVAITLSAEKNGVDYQDWVDQWNKDHIALFSEYDIGFTTFGRTTSENHKKIAQQFFLKCHESGYLKEHTEKQAYSPKENKYLPDRYLMGTCPKCDYPEARGDECPNCGSWLKANELKKPRSATSGDTELEWRDVKQWYFDLPKLAPKIREWLKSKTDWKERVRNYAISLLEETPERAITRNVSWGIDLPGEFHEEGKKIYVWFEAPVGYYSNLIEHFETSDNKEGWKDYWNEPSELVHFIGKDNIIFHTIIWPGMLMAAGERLPTNVPANMFVQLMKKQFSKSSGWYVDAREALQTYGVDRMRYYLTSIIPETEDTNFDWNLFREKVNAELVNKIANLFNRVGKMILKHYDGVLPKELFVDLVDTSAAHKEALAYLEDFKINEGLTRIVQLTEEANKFLDEKKPWNVVKEDKAAAQKIFAEVSPYMLSIAALLQPYLPSYSAQVLGSFSIPKDKEVRAKLYTSGASDYLTTNGLTVHQEADFVIPRIDPKQIEEEIEKLKSL